jgi:alkyl sulfatase BDS1-like metallo-beta-lactamase superfamily hydrolase
MLNFVNFAPANGSRARVIACIIAGAVIVGSAQPEQSRPAEPTVTAANQRVQSDTAFGDRQDYEDATRGFVATAPDPTTATRYAFLEQTPPPTVNPSLWRQAQLNVPNGLFAVAEGIYQVRGFSVSNMTIIEGKTGIVIVDTLASSGAARAALDLYFAHRPRRPVVGVIYTHSHGDHYGGASAMMSAGAAARGTVKVIAPVGFMDALTEEAAVAGNLKTRRGEFQFGASLPVGERGTIDYGEGKTGGRGPAGAGPIIPPNDTIRQPQETRRIDGVTFRFLLALGTEAPSEMLVYLPQSHVLDVAETATHTLHNLLPLRGTVVRDANRWSQSLNTALEEFGADVQVMIDQHQWPVWGNERVRAKLEHHRDLYKYLHDQTVRMMNQGMGPAEIAEALTIPPGLENDWSTRGYYGTLAQDSRAVYQRYIGWYDGNPATLNPLPRVEAARKYVEYMGGAEAVLSRARRDFDAGNYRWVAEVMERVVFADPANTDARRLAADAFEQLAYLAEAAPWRNAYLLAAQELRASGRGPGRSVPGISADVLHAMSIPQVFDYLGTRIDGPRAGPTRIVINWRFSDTGESLASTLSHGALTWVSGKADPHPAMTVTTTRATLEAVILGQRTLSDALQRQEVATDRDAKPLIDLWGLLVDFPANFSMVTPQEPPAAVRSRN